MKLPVYLGFSVLGLAFAMAPVSTASASVQYLHGSTAACVGALPAYQTSLRFSPYALINNGTANTFVTCSGTNLLSNPIEIVAVWFTNNTGASVDIDCTLATGVNAIRDTTVPKTQTYANGASGYLLWNYTTDNAGVTWNYVPAVSCILPPGVSLDFLTYNLTNPL